MDEDSCRIQMKHLEYKTSSSTHSGSQTTSFRQTDAHVDSLLLVFFFLDDICPFDYNE